MDDSPFTQQDHKASWDLCLEFDCGQKVYTHRFLLRAAFQFFEGLFEIDSSSIYSYKMPASVEQPVTADTKCV